jgi:hypothetical protein
MKLLSASALGITKEERRALLAVRNYLQKIPAVKNPNSAKPLPKEAVAATARFNMNWAVKSYDCGTGGCIGGWMSLSMQGVRLTRRVAVSLQQQEVASQYVRKAKSYPLDGLFYPPTSAGIDYDSITPKQAACQIVHEKTFRFFENSVAPNSKRAIL